MATADEIIAAVKATISGVINKDFPAIGAFAEGQLKAMAQQTVLIGEATAQGEFKGNDHLRDHFLNQLAKMAENFARVIAALVVIAIEKIWNALVDLLWDTLDGAAGFALPRPVRGG